MSTCRSDFDKVFELVGEGTPAEEPQHPTHSSQGHVVFHQMDHSPDREIHPPFGLHCMKCGKQVPVFNPVGVCGQSPIWLCNGCQYEIERMCPFPHKVVGPIACKDCKHVTCPLLDGEGYCGFDKTFSPYYGGMVNDYKPLKHYNASGLCPHFETKPGLTSAGE